MNHLGTLLDAVTISAGLGWGYFILHSWQVPGDTAAGPQTGLWVPRMLGEYEFGAGKKTGRRKDDPSRCDCWEWCWLCCGGSRDPSAQVGREVREKGWHGTSGHPELFLRVLLPKTGFTSWWVLTQWTQLNQEGRGRAQLLKEWHSPRTQHKVVYNSGQWQIGPRWETSQLPLNLEPQYTLVTHWNAPVC